MVCSTRHIWYRGAVTRPSPVKLTPRQWKAIELELEGTRPEAIWTHPEVRTTRASWYRWHDPGKSPAFCAQLLKARRAGLERAQAEWVAEVTSAIADQRAAREVLRGLAADKTLQPRDRIRAAAELGRLGKEVAASALAVKLPVLVEEQGEVAETGGLARVFADMAVRSAEAPAALEPQS